VIFIKNKVKDLYNLILNKKNILVLSFTIVSCLFIVMGVLFTLGYVDEEDLTTSLTNIEVKKPVKLNNSNIKNYSIPDLTIDFKPVSNSFYKDTVYFDKEGKYQIDATLNNKTGNNFYYRWVIANDFLISNISDCNSYTDAVSISRDINLSKNLPNIKISLRIYSDLNTCNSSFNGYIKEKTIKYSYDSKLRVDDEGWKLLNFDLKGIKRYIGSQKKSYCYDYGLSYGVYILSNGKKISNKLARNATCYGSSKEQTDSKQSLMEIIKSKIDLGIPVLVHVNNNEGGQHWVLVVGYKMGIGSEKMDRTHLYILDPGGLYYGVMSERKLSTSFRDYEYRTWKDISSAKACR